MEKLSRGFWVSEYQSGVNCPGAVLEPTGQSWKYICDGAYNHYNQMETRLNIPSLQITLQLFTACKDRTEKAGVTN